MEERLLSQWILFHRSLGDLSLMAKVETSRCQSQDLQLEPAIMKNLHISESPTFLLFSSSGQAA
jgi:hypothetical protein